MRCMSEPSFYSTRDSIRRIWSDQGRNAIVIPFRRVTERVIYRGSIHTSLRFRKKSNKKESKVVSPIFPPLKIFGERYVLAARCLFLFAILAGFPFAHAVTELRTAAHESTEPKFVSVGESASKSVTGICVDIFRAIERVEPSVRFVGEQTWMPMARHETEIASGSQDVACGLIRTSDREAKFIYLEPALFTVNYMLVARSNDSVQINNWDDVRKLGADGAVLVTAGHGPARHLGLLGGLTIDSGGKTAVSNLQKLVAGRGRFIYHRNPGITGEIRRAGFSDKVKVLPTVMHATKLYMLVGKHVPKATVSKIQSALMQLEKKGELVRLLDKWKEE